MGENNIVSLANYAETKINKSKYAELNNIGEFEKLQNLLEEHNIESHVVTAGLIVPIVMPDFILDVTINEDDYFEVNLHKTSSFIRPSYDWTFRYTEIQQVFLQVKALVECYSLGLDEGKHLQKIESKTIDRQ
ncbi:hypothetical protein OCB02_08790 [Bacillus cereus]|uniref:hypothetical protein n=1 Tax=Bacillus cereus TaxID=1396 RepID=UPI001E45027B|nr:hypothetical protein [Bacillus cereus]MCU5475839.1 hypothetical protein [Bacillus cereus]MCU5613136.1 hypothetical protein [Bacillus cereus]